MCLALYRLSSLVSIFWLSISFLSCLYGNTYQHHDEAHRITRRIFGPQAVDLPSHDFAMLEELIYQASTAPILQQYEAARYAFYSLQKKQDTLNQSIDRTKKEKKVVSLAQWHEHFAREVQLKHLKTFAQEFTKNLSFKNRLTITYNTLLNRLGIHTQAQALGKFLAHYYEKERTDILSDNQKSMAFFAAQKLVPLPPLMRAWKNSNDQQRIFEETKHSNPALTVQVASFLIDIGMQIALTSGESYTEKLFSEEDQKAYKALMDQQTALQRDFQSFQANLAQKTTDIIEQQSKAFTQKFNDIDKQRGVAQEYLVQEINYLMRSINVNIPKERYLTAPITYDQYFGASPMAILPGMPPWYNVFQTSWLFDQKTMSFLQQNSIPFNSPYEAAQNSIFTEYITSKSEYTIETEITLIDGIYPFFAGIIFNKARWLSGSEERLQQYRLAGIYGTPQKTIVLSFAQTLLKISPDGSPSITTPFAQIADASRQVLYAFPQADVDGLGKNPINLTLAIKTSMNSVTITLFKKIGDQKQQLASATIDSLDPKQNRALFWYHGIGFMSPGCQALFKIVQPTEVIQGRAKS